MFWAMHYAPALVTSILWAFMSVDPHSKYCSSIISRWRKWVIGKLSLLSSCYLNYYNMVTLEVKVKDKITEKANKYKLLDITTMQFKYALTLGKATERKS